MPKTVQYTGGKAPKQPRAEESEESDEEQNARSGSESEEEPAEKTGAMTGKKRGRVPVDDYSEEEEVGDEEAGDEEVDQEDEDEDEMDEDEEGGEESGSDAAPEADAAVDAMLTNGQDDAGGRAPPQLLAKIQEHVATIATKNEEIKTLTEDKEKLGKEVDELKKNVDRMTRTQAAQGREIDLLRYKCGEGPNPGGPVREGAEVPDDTEAAPAAAEPTQHALGRMRVPTQYQQHPDDFRLALLLPPDYETCELPRTYKNGTFHFPHRVAPAKSGARLCLLESRLLIYLACQLRNVPLNKNATEHDLAATRDPVTFKLEVCYAESGEVVQIEHLKTNPASLLEPPSALEPQRMTQGALKWKFHAKFLSRNTKPTGKEFIFKITCTNPELAQYDLSAETPPFAIVSREVSKKKGGAAAPAAQ